jgi:uncharacterized protein YqfA (UPF0365 family)
LCGREHDRPQLMRKPLGSATQLPTEAATLQFGPSAIIGMMIRGTPVRRLLRAARLAQREKLPISLTELEAHLLAGGNIERVLQAALEARRRGLPDNLRALTAADLAGEDLSAFLDRRYVFIAKRLDGSIYYP